MPAHKRHRRSAAIRRQHRNHPGTPRLNADPNPDELPDLATQRGFTPRNLREALHLDGKLINPNDWRTEHRRQYGDQR